MVCSCDLKESAVRERRVRPRAGALAEAWSELHWSRGIGADDVELSKRLRMPERRRRPRRADVPLAPLAQTSLVR
jgi:hypothetical protein